MASHSFCHPADEPCPGELRPESQRRTPPDRGLVLLQAKDRVGPEIWVLYGKVDRPVILRDDLYLDNSLNDFYRDNKGRCFLLVPYAEEQTPNRYQIADEAYKRAMALGITERPEIFFTCVYQFQLPEYCCIDIHAARGKEILEENKCHTLIGFEKARLAEQMGPTRFSVQQGKKIQPVTIHAEAEASINLKFALNTLILHHGYSGDKLQSCWDKL